MSGVRPARSWAALQNKTGEFMRVPLAVFTIIATAVASGGGLAAGELGQVAR
jgi:hypothetical protein